nr:Rho GDP-dissociation inhibitor 1-like [Tanacetum cinerariifolium]
MKNTVLTSNTSYPSRKIRRIRACTSPNTTKNSSSIRLEITKVLKPTPCVEQRTDDPTHSDPGEYEWKMNYNECKKIYAEAVIFLNKRLIRLIDVTVEQWLDLKYRDHKTIDKDVKKAVIDNEPWSEDGVPYEICDHICEPFHFKNGKTKWPTCNSNDDGFFNGRELPGIVRVGYMTYFQDYEWYDELTDSSLKEEALKQKAIYEKSWGDASQSDEVEQENNKRCELIKDREPPICKIRRFEMIKYSFGQEEEYVAIKEYEYDDLTRTKDDACHAYQEIFRNMDEGWLVTREKSQYGVVTREAIYYGPVDNSYENSLFQLICWLMSDMAHTDDKEAPPSGSIVHDDSGTSCYVTEVEEDTQIHLGPRISIKENLEKNKDDESLRKWKEQLLGSVDVSQVE